MELRCSSINKVKISSTQAVLLLFLCRMFTTVTFSPTHSNITESSSILLGDLLSVLVTVILMLPLFFLINSKNPDLICCASGCSKIFGKIVGAYFFLIIILLSIYTVTTFTSFITTAIFPNSSQVLIIVTFLIACTYGAIMGLEGVSRAGTIIFVVFLISIGFIIFALADNMKLYNIKPMVNEPVKSVITAIIANVSRNLEIVLLIILYPNINGSFTKISLGYIGLSSLFFLALGTVTVLILGDYTIKQIFPFYSVTAIAHIGVFQRMDALYMGLWVVLGYIRTTLTLIASSFILRRIFPSQKGNFTFILTAVVIGLFAIALSFNASGARFISSLFDTMIPTAIGIVLLPIVLIICIKKPTKAR